MKKQVKIGGNIFNPEAFTIEYCPCCDSEQVIYASGVTACPHCGSPLAPCSMCETCCFKSCPYGCTGTENDRYKEVTNPPLTEEFGREMYQYL